MTTEADKIREQYFDDKTLSNEEYGRMVEEADARDQANESDTSDEEYERRAAANEANAQLARDSLSS